MPTPANSLQNKDVYSSQRALHFPAFGEIYSFQHFTTPVSASGKGGRHYDPIARTRVKSAADVTRDVVEKILKNEAQTKRQVANQQHKPTAPDTKRQTKAQASYLNRLESWGDSIVPAGWGVSIGIILAIILAYNLIF